MSVFNFMETFFFISLGITFILILLLVYHFKERLSSVEHQSDTMFDIINNMVKEMAIIKTIATNANNNAFSFSQTQHADLKNEKNVDLFLKDPPVDVQQIYLGKDEDEDKSDSEDEDEDKSDSEDEDEDDKIIVSDDEDKSDSEEEEEEESEDEEEEESDSEDEEDPKKKESPITLVESEDILIEDIEDIEDIKDEVKMVTVLEEVSVEIPLTVNKVDISANEIVTIPDEKIETKTSIMEEYKKLGTSALKTLISSKGYATDVAKMKKPQLLQILEANL